MKKLLLLLLIFISAKVNAQWDNLGTTATQRSTTAKGYFFRNNLGSKGYVYWYTKGQIDSLLIFPTDSTLNKNKNLFDIPNKSTARLNLGITGLLNLKADDNAVVHKAGELSETITGLKTYTRPVTFPGNSTKIDSGGIQTNTIRRILNNVNTLIIAPSEANLINSIKIIPSRQFAPGSDTSHRRFVSGLITSLVKGQDTLVVSDSNVMDYGTFTVGGDINQSGASTGVTSAFYDKHTITSATDYASFRTGIQAGFGYAFKFTGTAPGLTNGDIEFGTIGKGVILKSPNGTRYRITVNNSGILVVTSL